MSKRGHDDLRQELKILKQRVAELEQAELAQYHLAALVASADDAIISKSLDGTIQTWNEGAQKIFGYAPSEIIGRPIFTLIPPELHDEEYEILRKIRLGERV